MAPHPSLFSFRTTVSPDIFIAASILATALAVARPSWSEDSGISPVGTEGDSRIEPYDDLPYLYQRIGNGEPMSLTMELETGFGTRDSRFFGQDGVEQGARLRFQPLSFLNLEGGGAIVLDENGYRQNRVYGELNARVLRQDEHLINLHLGGGYQYDYDDDHVPRVRGAVGRSFGRLDANLHGLLEIPTGAEGRDEADIMIGIASSYAMNSWWRQGIEMAVEDLEGLWEEEEAEGGARLLLGPTTSLRFWDRFQAKINVGGIFALTTNTPTVGSQESFDLGLMGRLALGYRL